jgi:hypothetical protein
MKRLVVCTSALSLALSMGCGAIQIETRGFGAAHPASSAATAGTTATAEAPAATPTAPREASPAVAAKPTEKPTKKPTKKPETVQDLDGGPRDPWKLDDVKAAFASAPREMLRVTTKPLGYWSYKPLYPNQALGRSKEKGATEHGLSVSWETCQGEFCLEFLTSKGDVELPAGALGLVWRNHGDHVQFVTTDGGLYETKADALAPYSDQPLAPPVVHRGLRPADVEHLVKRGELPATALEEMTKARSSVKSCMTPRWEAYLAKSEALDRQNILWHAKEARQSALSEEYQRSTTAACRKPLDQTVSALAAAIDLRTAARKALHEAVIANLGL